MNTCKICGNPSNAIIQLNGEYFCPTHSPSVVWPQDIKPSIGHTHRADWEEELKTLIKKHTGSIWDGTMEVPVIYNHFNGIHISETLIDFISQTLERERERIVKMIQDSHIEKPHREQDEKLYEIKRMFFAEFKATLINFLKSHD